MGAKAIIAGRAGAFAIEQSYCYSGN